MTNKRKTLILFDIGAVLVKLDYNSFFKEAARVRKCTQDEFAQMYHASNLEFDSLTGRLNREQNLAKLFELLPPSAHITEEQIVEMLKLTWPGKIGGVVDLKSRLYKAGYSVGLFSNISVLGVEIISSQWPDIFDVFDPSMPVVYSYQVGSIKPRLEMYRGISGYGRVILIDDKKSYLRTGIEKFGWIGIHFTPYIDPSEAIRSQHRDTTKPQHNFYVADSTQELKECLKALKIEI